jgi:hypothetical protein
VRWNQRIGDPKTAMKIDIKGRAIEVTQTGEEPIMDLAKGEILIIEMDSNPDKIDQKLRKGILCRNLHVNYTRKNVVLIV